jgi:hypothetical protein
MTSTPSPAITAAIMAVTTVATTATTKL